MDAWLPPLTALELLDVSENALSSTIPPLSNITRLRSFSVGLNQLNGTLPSDWLNSVFIREFDAASNRCIPGQTRATSTCAACCDRLSSAVGDDLNQHGLQAHGLHSRCWPPTAGLESEQIFLSGLWWRPVL